MMKRMELLKIKNDWLYFLKTYATDERYIRKPFSPFGWQEQVLSDIFQKQDGRLKYRICGISTPRQVGKTLLAIRIAQVYMNLVPNSSVIIINSASEDSATQTIFNRLKNVLRNQRVFKSYFKHRKNIIENTTLKCKAEVLSAEKLDVLGRTANLIIFDELWHLAKEKWNLWNELLPAVATITDKDAQIVAISTAGISDDSEQPMMNLYNHHVAQDMPELYFYYSNDPFISPLITTQSLETQKRLMASAYYKRNWLNLVGVKGETALTKEDIFKLLSPISKVHSSMGCVFIGVDVGLKKDLTALAVIGLEGDNYVLKYLKYWKPQKEMDFDELERFIYSLLKDFPNFMYVDFDAYQTFRTAQRLKNLYGDRINAIQFSANFKKELLKNLIVMIKSGKFKIYNSGDEIEVLKKQFGGLIIDSVWNSTHGKDGDDLVMAIGLALKRCVEVFPSSGNMRLDSDYEYIRSKKNQKTIWATEVTSPIFERDGRLTFKNQW